jgi:hypothetical protein
MWYASCSVGAHWIPWTVPVWVVPAEPSDGPCSSGTLSKPIARPDDVLLAAVEHDAVAELAAAELVPVALEEDDELLPQAASASAANSSSASATQPRPATGNRFLMRAQP